MWPDENLAQQLPPRRKRRLNHGRLCTAVHKCVRMQRTLFGRRACPTMRPERRSADRHRTIATATPPPRRGPRRRRSRTPGCPIRTRSHPRPASVLLRAHNATRPLTRHAGTARWTDSPERSPRTRPAHPLEPGFEAALGLALQWP